MGEIETLGEASSGVDHHKDERAPTEHHDKPMRATHLPEELMSSVLVFLRMRDLLGWRCVATSTKAM